MAIDLSSGAVDPYTQLLQQLQQSILRGNPQTSTGGTATQTTQQRLSPEEEASANQTAFGGLMTPNYGMVDPNQVSSYFSLAQPYLFGQGMEGINQQLAAAGFSPGASSGGAGAAPIGPQAELAARLQSQLGVQQANALLQNASTGATAQANAGLSIGKSRYGTLTLPNTTTTKTEAQQKPGTGATSVQYPQAPAANSQPGAGGAGGEGGGESKVPTGAQNKNTGAGGASDFWGPNAGVGFTTSPYTLGQNTGGGAGVDWNSMFPSGVTSGSSYGNMTVPAEEFGTSAYAGLGGGQAGTQETDATSPSTGKKWVTSQQGYGSVGQWV